MKKRVSIIAFVVLIIIALISYIIIKRNVDKKNYIEEEELIGIGFDNLYYGYTKDLIVTEVYVYRLKNDSYILIEYRNITREGHNIKGFMKLLENENVHYYWSQAKDESFKEYEDNFQKAVEKGSKRQLSQSEILVYTNIYKKEG